MQLVLSLFPGIGLLDRAFIDEGFSVVRSGDPILGGDIRDEHWPAGRFDGCIGGPPCQIFSQLRHLNPSAGERFGNLIPEFERAVIETQPSWFLMENVPAAPRPQVDGYIVKSLKLNNRWFGAEQERTRVFSFGTRDGQPLLPEIPVFESQGYVQAVTGSARSVPVKIGGSGKIKRTYTDDGKRHGPNNGPRMSIGDMLSYQGFERTMLDDSPLTNSGKRKAVGNGVPFHTGRAIARAVKEAMAGNGGY